MKSIQNSLRTGSLPMRWPWYIALPIAFLIFHLGTRASIYFSVAPGTALWYWPIPLGLILIQWWGPKVLLPLYLNAALSADLWGLHQWQFWPIYALPETGQVFLSWLLFTRFYRGQPWLPDLKNQQRFLIWGIFVPSLICNLWLQGQFLLLGDIHLADIGPTFLTNWVADLLGNLVVASSLLYLLTPIMEKTGLSLTNSGQRPNLRARLDSLAWLKISLLMGLIWIVSLWLPPQDYWFIYGIIILGVAFESGLTLVFAVNAWTICCVLFLPAFLPGLYQWHWLATENWSVVYLSLICLFTAGISVARALEELRANMAHLAESESRFRLLAENSTDMISRHDTQGHYLYASPACRTLLGYEPEELVGHSAFEFIHPDDMATVEQSRSTIIEQPVNYTTVFRIRRKNGDYIWLETTGRTIFEKESGDVLEIHAATRDITERKQTEDALRQSEARYRAISELMSDYTFSARVESGGRITPDWVAGAFQQITGYSWEEFIARGSWPHIVHPDHLANDQLDLKALLENRPINRELRIVTKSGEFRWILNFVRPVWNDQQGRVTELIGAVRDITKRKRAEEALQQAEELFRAVVEDQTEMIVRWKPDGTRTFVNQAYCRTFGKTYEEIVGTSFWPLVAGPFRERKLEWIRSLSPGSPYSTSVHLSLLPDGSTQWQEWADHGFFDEHGHLTELQSVGRDITERKRVEQEDRQHAARRETLAEISQALANVGLDTQAVFDTIARYTAEHIGDSCAIRLLSSDKQWLNLVAFHNPIPEMAMLLAPAYLTPMPANQEWFRQILETGKSLILPVITEQQVNQLLPVGAQLVDGRFRLHSALFVPLRAEGQVIGTIALTRVEPDRPAYTANDQVLLQELADRVGLTIQNARLFEQVEGARERLEALSHRLLEVQEAERRALTSELHDRVGQNLTGLSINLQNMKALLPDETAKTLATKFDDAQALVQDTTRQIRDIMAELHLPELEDYGLAAALETYAERVASRAHLELIADLPDLPTPRLSSDVRIALFRAAQEAISNVLKHAKATRLEICLEQRDGRLCLTVGDNGQGFEPEAASQKTAQTWGLNIMRERIESIGGDVQIESKPGEGTRVTFEVGRPQ